MHQLWGLGSHVFPKMTLKYVHLETMTSMHAERSIAIHEGSACLGYIHGFSLSPLFSSVGAR